LRLLLYDLSQLLELGVVAQELETIGVERSASIASSSASSRTGASTTSRTTTSLTGLGGGLEQIYRLISARGRTGGTCVAGGSSWRRGRRVRLCGLRLLLTCAVWNTLGLC
jgi:hypothetical protein